ncbi:MAG: hypothetical protein ACREPE_10960, partial [Lysobacter sp.]
MSTKTNNALAMHRSDFSMEVEPGGIKRMKLENRRSDAMSFVAPDKLTVIEGFNVRVRDEAYF